MVSGSTSASSGTARPNSRFSAIRKLGHCVLRRIISRTVTQCRIFSGIAKQIFINCDIERWKSFAVKGGDFAYSDILHSLSSSFFFRFCCRLTRRTSRSRRLRASEQRHYGIVATREGIPGATATELPPVDGFSVPFLPRSAAFFRASSCAVLAAASISAFAWARVLPS